MPPTLQTGETVTVAGFRFRVGRMAVQVAPRTVRFDRVTKPAVGLNTQVDSTQWWIFDSPNRADSVFQRIRDRLQELRAADQAARDYKAHTSADRAAAEAEAAGESALTIAFARRWGAGRRASPSRSFVWQQLRPALPTDRPGFDEVAGRIERRRGTELEERREDVARQFTDQQLREMPLGELFELISGAETAGDRAAAQRIYNERTGGGSPPIDRTGGSSGTTAVATVGSEGGSTEIEGTGIDASDLLQEESDDFSVDRLVAALRSGDMGLIVTELRSVPPIWWIGLIGVAAVAWATVTGRDFGSMEF